jgi:hypothetical protein
MVMTKELDPMARKVGIALIDHSSLCRLMQVHAVRAGMRAYDALALSLVGRVQ